MSPDAVQRLRDHYSTLQDSELATMALTAAADLVPAAIEPFRSELQRRSLAPELWPTLDLQVGAMTPAEHDELVRRIQFLPCPLCGQSKTSLNGYVTQRGPVIPLPGVLLVRSGFYIGCQPCLSGLGAWRLFKLKPGQRWKPSSQLRQFVERHAALFIHFERSPAAIRALLRRDYDAFLTAIRDASADRHPS